MSADVAELEQKLNNELMHHRFMSAFDAMYADDVQMQENTCAPVVGKAANLQRQLAFYDSVEEFHESRLLGFAVSGNRSYSEWEFEFTLKNGVRVTMAEVCARQWRDGKVIFERFYWNQAAYPGAV